MRLQIFTISICHFLWNGLKYTQETQSHTHSPVVQYSHEFWCVCKGLLKQGSLDLNSRMNADDYLLYVIFYCKYFSKRLWPKCCRHTLVNLGGRAT